MDAKEVITLEQKQVLEIEEIVLEKDKESALKFLEEYIYKPLKKRGGTGCKPPF